MTRRRAGKPKCPKWWGSHGCKKTAGHSGDCICICKVTLAYCRSLGAEVHG